MTTDTTPTAATPTADATPAPSVWPLRFAAWLAVLLGSLFNLLNFNGYPILSAEVALVVVGLVGIAAVLARTQGAFGRLSFLVSGLLVAIAIDMNSDAGMRMVLFVGAIAAALSVLWEPVVTKLVAAAFGTVAVFQLLGGASLAGGVAAPAVAAPAAPQQIVSKADGDLPPIVHILLDSFQGTGGMAADPANFAALRRDSLAYWQAHGFRLYDGAYSRHANTVNSIPAVLSLGQRPLAQTVQKVQYLAPGKLEYFGDLNRRGYRIHAVLPDYVDVCPEQGLADCRTFRRSDLSSMSRFPVPTGERAAIIGTTMMMMGLTTSKTYNAVQKMLSSIGLAEPTLIDEDTKLFPLASARELDRFSARMERIEPGNAYFIHALLPHDPYVFDRNCTVQPRSRWQGEDKPKRPLELRARLYGEQTRCLMKRLDTLFARLDATETGRRAIVIVHGDHGARLVTEHPGVDKPVSARDMAMTYSTHFAIRAPQIAPGVVTERAAIEDLLGQFVTADFAAAPEPQAERATVVLADFDWIPRQRVPLPEFSRELTTR